MAGTIGMIVALTVAALVLLALEILTPTFGVLAAMAIAALVAGVWLAFSLSPAAGAIVLIAYAVGVPLYLVVLVRRLPKSRAGRGLFLRSSEPGDGQAAPESASLAALVGRTATAETDLHPVGAIRVDGRRVIATAESGMIDKGQTVRVVRARGADVIVRRCDA
ncbi:MAG TPA: NfeD family protein [Phycisphaerae bacterium]|nr:NfeD family protein [Phycisphaerae bacterium]